MWLYEYDWTLCLDMEEKKKMWMSECDCTLCLDMEKKKICGWVTVTLCHVLVKQ